MSLLENVLAAKAAAEAVYSAQTESGQPLSETQKAEILIAQVRAIIADPTPIPVPEEKS